MTKGQDKWRKLTPYAVGAGLLAVAVAGHLASVADTQIRSGAPVDLSKAIVDELTSAIAWLAMLPAIAGIFRWAVPSRSQWWLIITAHLIGIPLISLSHFILTRILRTLLHASQGTGSGFFFTWSGYVYDLYGDVLTYLIFGLVYMAIRHWMSLTLQSETVDPTPAPQTLEIRDGTQTTFVGIADILWAEAAGNYVEIHAVGGKKWLMRSTFSALLRRLGNDEFPRIHRSRLVNLSSIKSIENMPGGDALVTLTDGTETSASRRYKPVLIEATAKRRKAVS